MVSACIVLNYLRSKGCAFTSYRSPRYLVRSINQIASALRALIWCVEQRQKL